MNRVSVIIVLYNEFELVKTCLTSIYGEGHSLEVILVDNSTDKLGHRTVISKFPKVKLIQNRQDLGFGRGVNVGIKRAKGEFILVLTPDMYLLPGIIKELLLYIQAQTDVGLIGGRVYSSPRVQEPSVLSSYPGFLTQLYYYNMPFYKLARRLKQSFNPMYASMKDHGKIQISKAIIGQSMLIRKKAFEEIGGFDPRFFLYFEDIDLCKRMIEAGWKVVYLPIDGVVQNGLSEWKGKIRITQALPPYMKSLYLYFEKHNGKFYTVLAWVVGASSVLMSIPYLLVVSRTKMFFKKRSQSSSLLPLWIKIVRWHFTDGLKLVFK